MRRCVRIAIAALMLSPSTASAEDGYRWQVITVDALADGMTLCKALVEDCDLAVPGAVLYWAGGPMIHFLHDQPSRGFASLGLRFGVPLAGAAVGALATYERGEEHHDGTLTAALVGFAAGIVGAQVLDAALLAGPTDEDADGLPRARMITLGGSF